MGAPKLMEVGGGVYEENEETRWNVPEVGRDEGL